MAGEIQPGHRAQFRETLTLARLSPAARSKRRNAVRQGSVMGQQSLQWLIAYSELLGVRFQNWMPVVAGVVAVEILYLWFRERFSR
jgi:hypothetical protein